MQFLAIDFNSLMNRSFFAIRHLSTRDGVETNALLGFAKTYQKLLAVFEPDGVLAAFDVHAPTFRHKMFDGYKGTRSPMPEELRPQMPLGREFVTLAGGTVLGIEGFEADDILGTMARRCEEEGHTLIIATGDRDSLQLVSDKVSVNLASNKGDILYTPETVFQQYGVTPPQLIEVKSLMGDSSDNIPGVKGIGEKTALSLIANYHSLEDILARLDDLPATPRIKKLIADHKEEALLSHKLGEICREVPLPFALEELAHTSRKDDELKTFLTRYELTSVLKAFGLEEEEKQLSFEACPAPAAAAFSAEEDPEPEILRALPAAKPVYFTFYEDGPLTVLTGADRCAVFAQRKEEALSILMEGGRPLVTFDAKPVYRHLFRNGAAMPPLMDDAKLLGYLLSNSDKAYSIPELFATYCGERPLPEGREEIAALKPAFTAMRQKVSQGGMDFLYEEIERPLCRVLASMEEEGFMVDEENLTQFGEILSGQIETIREELFTLAGQEFNPNSPAHLSEILFEKLGLPAGKKTKTGYSTNAEVLEGLIPYHPIVGKILEYRKLSKLYSTYVVGLKKCLAPDSRVHSTFNQTETRTGRISSSDPNVQNIPVRTELGAQMRKFFVAREGFTLVDADYSQIELRILAAISGDEAMIAGFQNGADIHRMTASQVFHIPFEEVPPEVRSRAKAINFGIVYGISAFSLSQDIHVSVKEAKEYIDSYLETYSGVAAYMKQTVETAREKGYVETLFKRPRYLPDIRSKKPALRSFSERVAMNMPIQGTAADIIKIAMVKVWERLYKEGLRARLILQVHDELLVECPPEEAEKVSEIVKTEMENAVSLPVALSVDIHEGKNWYLAKG